jgi:hypothetical protein
MISFQDNEGSRKTIQMKASTEGLVTKMINMVLTVCGKETISNVSAATLFVVLNNSELKV